LAAAAKKLLKGHGVKLPNSVGEFQLPYFDIYGVDQIAVDPVVGAIYSIPLETGDLMTLYYGEQGVVPGGEIPSHRLVGDNYIRFALDGGLIYTSQRQVIDPMAARVVGTFAGQAGQRINSFVAPDSSTGRIAFLAADNSWAPFWKVDVYDQRTREFVGSFGIPNFTGSVKRLVRWGGNGLAFLTGDGQLFVIRTPLLSASGGTALPELTPPPKPPPYNPAFTVRTLSLPNNDLIYDSSRGLIYASVPSNAAAAANSVASIEPATGAVVSSLPVGVDPGKLAVSAGGEYLYVALNGEEAVRRIDLAKGEPSPPVSIKGRALSPLYAIDMEVLPDDPGKVLIARVHINGGFRQFLAMLYYNNGSIRLPEADGPVGTGAVEMSDTPGIGYAMTGGFSGVHYGVFETGPDSYNSLRVVNNIMGGGYTPDFTYQDGLLFTAGGSVGDPDRALLLGKNSLTVSPLESAQVAPDPRAGRVYYLIGGPPLNGNGPTTWTLRAYDLRTFLHLWTINVPGVIGHAGPLLRWGAHGLAFGTSGGQVFLVDSPAVAAPEQSPPSLQFAAPEVRVEEGAGSLQLTVTRTGPLYTSAAVSYRTVGRTASPRGDFSAAAGTIRFHPGESSKTLSLHVTDDRLSEPEESFDVVLGGPSRATLGLSTTSVTIQDDDAASGPSAVGDAGFDPGFFVRQHYVDFLGREPDPNGLDFWTHELQNCGADVQCREVRRVNVSAAFFLSIEFQQTGYFVYRLYQAAYGRRVGGVVPLRLDEFLSDTNEVGQGVIVGRDYWETNLREGKRNFVSAFVARPEFVEKYPLSMTAESYVDALDANTGGSLTADERRVLIFILEGRRASRAEVLYQIVEKAAFRQRELNRAFVLMQYFGYLRRDPDSAPDSDFSGYRFWLSKLEQFNGNFVEAEMVKAFITSDEYRKRFGQ
jgi:hypothetical protein